ncbi:zf-C2HC5-domain-containing protein [Rhizoclosmatium globosum]|uniref:Zf-C2HC5-domain-containing protein n=1 Tax=Rhizoclosmatium globosum TaxID=329046 RepID=A0A1Y2CFZ2_9FUNG|nr:zf-C2HC5-domain-containing protein [Rhizoclosmatium globosum]|eukprot:ORY45225.1 zf-C2HC5-domain-containing protein [Rhizoclosmatium globosum]
MSLSNWTTEQLCKLLGLPAPAPGEASDLDPLVQEVLSLPPADAAAHLSQLLGDERAALDFISEFSQRRSAPATPTPTPTPTQQQQKKKSFASASASATPSSPSSPQQKQQSSIAQSAFKDPNRVYRKKDADENYFAPTTPKTNKDQPQPRPEPPATVTAPAPATAKKQSQKKKQYVVVTVDSLSANDKVGTLMGLNNRPLCECLAAKHGLLTNCLTCGKIVCNLEGPGPCPSCGSIVESAIQQVTMIQSRQSSYQVSPVHTATAASTSVNAKQGGTKSKAPAPGQHVVNRYGLVSSNEIKWRLKKAGEVGGKESWKTGSWNATSSQISKSGVRRSVNS